MFPAGYQYIQELSNRHRAVRRVIFDWLKIQEASGKSSSMLTSSRSNQRVSALRWRMSVRNQRIRRKLIVAMRSTSEVLEIWCDYDINGDGLPEHLALTYQLRHRDFSSAFVTTGTSTQRQAVHADPLHCYQRFACMVSVLVRCLGCSSRPINSVASDGLRTMRISPNIRMFIAAKDAQVEDQIRMLRWSRH